MGKLIEKEGRFYKECSLIMLEAESSDIILRNKDNVMHHRNHYGTAWKDMGDVYQHLYITSDDEIKEGDWFINIASLNPEVAKACENGEGFVNCPKYSHYRSDCKKIIASTDLSLQDTCFMCNGMKSYLKNICSECDGEGGLSNLPQPSDKFIQAFIDAYNKGEKIEKVLVERANKCLCYPSANDIINCNFSKPIDRFNKKFICSNTIDSPKLKDNNIIIKKVKDSWTREEIYQLLSSYRTHVWGNDATQKELEKWIEENL